MPSIVEELLSDVIKDSPGVGELIRANEKAPAPRRRRVKPEAIAVTYQTNPPHGFPASKWSVGGLQMAMGPTEATKRKKSKSKTAQNTRFWHGLNHSVRDEFGGFEQEDFITLAFIEEDDQGRWVTVDGRRILIGAAPLRTTSVNRVSQVHGIFAKPEVLKFEEQIPAMAKNFEGVHIDKLQRAAGVWQESREASFVIEGHGNDSVAVDAFAAKLGADAPERQMATIRFAENPEGKGAAYELQGIRNEDHAVDVLLNQGFEGQTVPLGQGRILLFDFDGSLRANVDLANEKIGGRLTVTKGDVRLIEENDYKSVQNEYRREHGQVEERLQIHRRDCPSLEEEITDEVKARLFLQEEDGDVHWITTGDGRHIPIGGDSGGGIRPNLGSAHPLTSTSKVSTKNVETLANTLSDTHGRLGINADKIENPELKTFVKGIDEFTAGANGPYKTLSSVTEKLNMGDVAGAKSTAGNDETFRKAEIINQAVKSSAAKQVHVWRGLGTNAPVKEIESLKPGDSLNIAGVKSFSHYRSVSVQYAKHNGNYNYFFEVRGEAKGISIAGLSRAPSEHEFITQGKFAVDSVRVVSQTTRVVRMHQVGVF